MSGTTNIQWTEKTWNAGIFGCAKVSEGCRNCYAMQMAARIAGAADARERAGGIPTAKQAAYQKVVMRRDGKPVGKWNNTIVIDPEDPEITAPLRVRKPAMWFVDSMHDWFHPDVPFDHLDRLFAVMALCPHHTFQVLTKRPERMAEYLNDRRPGGEMSAWCGGVLTTNGGTTEIRRAIAQFDRDTYETTRPVDFDARWPLPNVWLGTSCEDQRAWDERVPHLMRCRAAVLFVSAEPLLGAIECGFDKPVLTDLMDASGERNDRHRGTYPFRVDADHVTRRHHWLDWIIVGGESGPNARPMDPDWARAIRDQCKAAGVAFFMKQMGGRSGHKGAMEDLPEDLRVREFPR